MKTTCTLIRKTDLQILIESGNKDAIKSMIEQKEKALNNAIENVEYWTSRGMFDCEFCNNERSRAGLLQRDINKLKSVLS